MVLCLEVVVAFLIQVSVFHDPVSGKSQHSATTKILIFHINAGSLDRLAGRHVHPGRRHWDGFGDQSDGEAPMEVLVVPAFYMERDF